MPSLVNDVRQMFSEAVLQRYERLNEARITFTFNHGDIYLSTFAEAFDIVDNREYQEFDRDLLAHAQVFEHFVHHPVDTVDKSVAGLISASLYWLSGYSANALVIARAISSLRLPWSESGALLLKIFLRQNLAEPTIKNDIDKLLVDYFLSGNEERIQEAINQAQELRNYYLRIGSEDEFVTSHLLVKVLDRLQVTSFWYWVIRRSSAPIERWQEYTRFYLHSGMPMIDLWPSQRTAITKGLLDGTSSVVIRMPTSSGKTKMTELAFMNDLYSNPGKRCLYLAPFRALVSEVENTIGSSISQLGFPVASLYGGSEANELEAELTNIARVIIATPEKMAAVLRLSGGHLSDFDTIVLDEGHLLDSHERGTAYELQLATLRPQLAEHNRVIFLSAVLPNSSELASWLKGTTDILADENWQPTTMRVGFVTWPRGNPARLDYVTQTGQALTDDFFVPRLFNEDAWSELNPGTGRMNAHSYPIRGSNSSVAAVLSFQAVKSGPVMIYTSRPDWANSIAKDILDRLSLQRPITTNLVNDENRKRLTQLATYLRDVLGVESILPSAVINGFAMHHGGIPQWIRLILEEEFRNQTIRLLIATNTIAQGVNFPVKTIIVHSLPASDAPIRDFWNLAGRAGRALKETEGEVIVLGTGSLRLGRLRQFLNVQNSERAESRILYFVKELLNNYPLVSNETITTLLQDHPERIQLSRIIRAIDAYLLEIIAEDSSVEGADPNFETFVNNLFATHQASLIDENMQSNLSESVRELFRARRISVLQRVPDGKERKRYANSGLSVESSVSLGGLSQEIQEFFVNNPVLTQDAFKGIIKYISSALELENQDPQQLAVLGYEWIKTGKYEAIKNAAPSLFITLDAAVKYVEEVLCFQVPWVLNGFDRLLEQVNNKPDWFHLLPGFLRYGVDKQSYVWVMSLGFNDRRFSEWIINAFRLENGSDPTKFKDLVRWIIGRRRLIGFFIERRWPRYFKILFDRIIERYQRIYEILSRH